MTKEEALNLYWQVRYEMLPPRYKEAVDVAFEALREQVEGEAVDD